MKTEKRSSSRASQFSLSQASHPPFLPSPLTDSMAVSTLSESLAELVQRVDRNQEQMTTNQREVMAQMSALMQQMSTSSSGKERQSLKDSSSAPSNGSSTAGNEDKTKLKVEKVGYFDLAAEEEGYVITIGKYIVYKEVFVFIERLQVLLGSYSESDVVRVIPICFRGDVMKWHSNEFNVIERIGFNTFTVSQWKGELIKRFKMWIY